MLSSVCLFFSAFFPKNGHFLEVHLFFLTLRMLFVVFLMLQVIDFLVFFEKKLFREVLLIFDLLIYLHVVIVIHFL